VPDISVWLQELGLGKYAKAFEENEIDFESLPHLTAGMLERMGLPIGPRVKLLTAIAELRSSAHPESKRKTESTEGSGVEPRRERRQVTVMFCDLVDSTKLARSLDLEDFRLVIQSYQRACGRIIERHDGHVSQLRGDGIEAIFGWPAAHEDSAERAVRTGLEVIEAVKTVDSPQPLSVRVAITTGMVVTGREEVSSSSGAVGGAFYIAARLQILAEPSSLVIADATKRLLSDRFELEDLGPQNLTGIVEPVHVFRVHNVRDDTSRFQAARATTMTPLVGRDTELAFLQQRWRDVKGGDGHTVFVSGMPGIGKSRIVYELESLIAGERHLTLHFQCLPHCMQSALFPVIRQIESLANLAPEDSNAVKLHRIERLLSRATNDVHRAVSFVAEMMSIPRESGHAPLAPTPQAMKTQTLLVLVELLLAVSTRRPVLCVLEDAQWIDPSTQELLDLLVGRVEKGRILLIVTHRPEYQLAPDIQGKASVLMITRLGRRDVAEMTRLAFRDHAASSAVTRRIIEESDSIPLFIEELARGAIESGDFDQNELTHHRAEPRAPGLVPDSLRDSLVARLDRAPQARSVAQMAAVIGREFSYDMLQRVSSLSSSELDSTLAHLKQSEIVQLIDDRPPPRYVFKHALVRDAAYETLLMSSRREIHARIASILEQEWPDIVAGQPELLAHHYSLAGKAEFAVRHWLLGGRRARSRSANLEAIVQFQKALEFLRLLPDTPERTATELEIQLSLGLCFIAVLGYSADETRQSFERARSLSVDVGKPHREVQAIYGLWGHHWMRARHDRALELGETLLEKAERLDDPIIRMVGYRALGRVAHRVMGSTLLTIGEFQSSRQHFEKTIALSTAKDERPLYDLYMVDPQAASLLLLSWNLWFLGYPDQSLSRVSEGLALARELRQPYTIAFALYMTSVVHLLRGDPESALASAEQCLEVSREQRFSLYILLSRISRARAIGELGRLGEARNEMKLALDDARRDGIGFMLPMMDSWLADVHAKSHDYDTALSIVEHTLTHIDDVTGRSWESELHRQRGEILLAFDPARADEAELSFRQALDVACRQSARSLELRAATSLANVRCTQQRRDEARDLIEPVYRWFAEGAETADVRHARKLLEALN
jgi:class 3 adenylate cyclase/tetratricopeptide (TPR) repeat protein